MAGESPDPRVKAIKTVPYVPLSHPFVERLIGTIRRECRTARCFGRPLIWKGSSSISNSTLTDIERMRDWMGVRPSRALTWAADSRLSVRIAGSRTVAGSTRRHGGVTCATGCTWATSETRAVPTDGMPPCAECPRDTWRALGFGLTHRNASCFGMLDRTIRNSPPTGREPAALSLPEDTRRANAF